MKSRRNLLTIACFFTVAVFIVAGCGDDDPTTPPGETYGKIGIRPSPISINAPWSIVGPDSSTFSGSGDADLENLLPGEYVLTWGEVEGYVPPEENPATRLLSAGAIAMFGSPYVLASDPGVVIVDPNPNLLMAGWELTKPDGYLVIGDGDTVLLDMPVGDYVISWATVEGYGTPTAQTRNLTPNDTISFSATYLAGSQPATITIDTHPDEINAPWRLIRPDEQVVEGNGDEVLEEMPAGLYSIEWLPVQDWNNPAPNPASFVLFSNSPRTVSCEYTVMYVTVPAGSFSMGNNSTVYGDSDELPTHNVTLSNEFEIGVSEITQAQFEYVMGYNPSSDQASSGFPVENVSWYEAIEFCNTLSENEGRTPAYTVNGVDVTWNQDANGYRLPTEAEWEYACRAGSSTDYYNRNLASHGCEDALLGDIAWYCGSATSLSFTRNKIPNAFGIYGMHGNVWEWCWDRYGAYDSDAQTDPTGPESGHQRVVRGGAFDSWAKDCRSSNRARSLPGESDQRDSNKGFRVIRTN